MEQIFCPWSAAVLGVPRDGQIRQGRPRDADLIRHHKTCRRKVAEPSLVRRVTTARVFHIRNTFFAFRGTSNRSTPEKFFSVIRRFPKFFLDFELLSFNLWR